MSKYKCILCKPKDINQQLLDQISSLHRKYLNLDDLEIINQLMKRDKVYIFIDKETQRVVATIGVSIFEIDDKIIEYIGNLVIDAPYYKEGFLLKTLLKVSTRICLTHPFKKKYVCALALRNTVYNFASKLDSHWPNSKCQTPKNILDLMLNVAEVVTDKTKLIVKDGVIISKTFRNNKIIYNNNNNSENNFFKAQNPNANYGDQMLILIPINLANFVKVISMKISVNKSKNNNSQKRKKKLINA